jgi:ATP-binding cassette, subfamily A (ABC1), member 3
VASLSLDDSIDTLSRFIAYIGIVYHLPGAVTAERANLLTSHMKAMGLLESARIVYVTFSCPNVESLLKTFRSWHLSLSLAYIPAWTVVSIIWHYRIFTETPAGLVFIIHIIFGLILASHSFFTSAPFGKSPQLAAVTSTLYSFVLAIIGLVFKADTAGAVVFSLFFPPSWYIFTIRAICGWELRQQTPRVLEEDPSFGLMLLPLLIIGIVSVQYFITSIWVGGRILRHFAAQHIFVAMASMPT